MRIGGPSLLHAFSQQNKLPSSSYIYKLVKSTIKIEYSIEKDYRALISQNMLQFFKGVNGFYAIKMDEFGINQKARWSPSNNEIIGFCFNHCSCVGSWKFNNWLNLEDIKRKFLNRQIHLAKEALFITIGQITVSDVVPKPILVVPVCSHTLPQIVSFIETSIATFESQNENAFITNISTDGDPYRRKVLEEQRRPCYDFNVSQMKYFDNNLFLGKYGINYDIKHLIKRIRGIIISPKRSITLIKRSINREHIEAYLPELKSLLNPSDYQNVPVAVQLLKGLTEIKKNVNDNTLVVDIKNEIELLAIISELLLSLFTKPTINLLDQLFNMAKCSILLLHIYRKFRSKFMTKDLYKDIESTIQSCFVATKIFFSDDKNSKLFLYQLGTDELKSFFVFWCSENIEPFKK